MQVRRWKYMRTLVADGNFKQDHLAMNNDSNDVALSDGLGFMVTRKRFEQYLDAIPKNSKKSNPTPTVIKFTYLNSIFQTTDDVSPVVNMP